MCERNYKCKLCQKFLERSKRKPNEHICGEWKCTNCFEYQMGQHLCYQRKPSKHLKIAPRKYFFYDFECTQNEIMHCEEGFTPREPCTEMCNRESRCNKCRKCVHCGESLCGLEEHQVNFAVLQSACDKCINEELTSEAKCQCCDSRCVKCNVVKKKLGGTSVRRHMWIPTESFFRGKCSGRFLLAHYVSALYKYGSHCA